MSSVRSVVVGVCLLLLAAGCNSVTRPDPPTPRDPTPAPTDQSPVVTRLSLASGITAGSDWLDIFGTFERGATVTIGGQPAVMMSDSGTLFVLTPPNPAGVADLVVTNPNGRSVTVREAFTYLPPYRGDFNGTWAGYAGVDGNVPVRFTIEHDTVISVKCGSVALRTLTVPAPVVGGGFSVVEPGELEVTGSLISENWAGGLIRYPACADIPLGWRSER
jgi:hypothetical protein